MDGPDKSPTRQKRSLAHEANRQTAIRNAQHFLHFAGSKQEGHALPGLDCLAPGRGPAGRIVRLAQAVAKARG